MSRYIENNLGKNENIVQKAKLNGLFLLSTWIKGILFFWLLFIPLIKAIAATVRFKCVELGITNKRIIGKTGFANTSSLDAPLNKIQNVSVHQPLGGKIFNYGTVIVHTAAGVYNFEAVKNPNQFKGSIMSQIDQYEEDRVKQQAEEMAKSMASIMNR